MKNYSIAIFGSALRTNFDKYSDKDLLIVSSSYSILNKLKETYEREGFSVSTYTYKKLSYLSKHGNLFVQHLKKESSIVQDYRGKLENILKNHMEVIPTESQIKEAFEYFTFLKLIPDNTFGYAWFCDCLYVGIRNYLILKSAEKGNYDFSFLRLIEELQDANSISNRDYHLLRELRVLKKNYRERIDSEFPSKNYIIELIVIAKKLRLLSDVCFVTNNDFEDYFKKFILKSEVNHYYKLRLTEIYYLTKGIKVQEIDKIICNPQFYALKFRDSNFINNIIRQIDEKNVVFKHKKHEIQTIAMTTF